jgi:flavorubredoxin
MAVQEIAKGIYSVGALDWDIRDMHGYSTNRGTTYNAYLIIDKKITLLDTVKHYCMDQLLENIRQIIDPAKIDYIIANHIEMDHSGGITQMMELCKPEKLICSPMGKKALLDHFHQEDWPYEVVKSGSEISLGKRTLQFLETRMLHWPDSMFSYLKEDGILFSNDAFAEHLCTSERYDDEIDMSVLMQECGKYYANILYPYSGLVKKVMETVDEMNLDIKMIAPDHGVIWRKHIDVIFEAYRQWSRGTASKKVLIIYETMWDSTRQMALAVEQGLLESDVSVKMINLKTMHYSDVIAEVLDARAILLGSSTLNNGMLPAMNTFIYYMKGLKPFNKLAASFGSFGWSGEAVGLMNGILEDLKLELVDTGIKHKYVPTEEALEACTELGRRVGAKVAGEFTA